ncbi:MAG: hypothetical protein WC465_04730 [Patescibacteria group bacterium]
MLVILNILNRRSAQWLLVRQDKIVAQVNFILSTDQDKLLFTLDKLLKKNKISLAKVKGLFLLVHETSLTQIKLFTATINTLAWYHSLPVMADWHYLGKIEDDLKKITASFKKVKKFKPLVVTYQRPPDITISKKRPKFTIHR